MTKPITSFRQTIARSKSLLELYETGPILDEPKDLIRSSVVLAIAGLDFYFTSKFCDILVPYLKKQHPSNELLSILEKSGLNSRTALELIAMKRPYRRVRTLVQNSMSYHTTQKTDVIDKLFKSVGIKNLSITAQTTIGRNTIIRRTASLVTKRNEIAHAAHLNTHNKPRNIEAPDILARIDDMALFVEECEKYINSKL